MRTSLGFFTSVNIVFFVVHLEEGLLGLIFKNLVLALLIGLIAGYVGFEIIRLTFVETLSLLNIELTLEQRIFFRTHGYLTFYPSACIGMLVFWKLKRTG